VEFIETFYLDKHNITKQYHTLFPLSRTLCC